MPWELNNDLMDLRGKKVAFREGHPLAETTGVVIDIDPYPVDHPIGGAVARVRLDGTGAERGVGCHTDDLVVIDPITGESMEASEPDEPSDEVI